MINNLTTKIKSKNKIKLLLNNSITLLKKINSNIFYLTLMGLFLKGVFSNEGLNKRDLSPTHTKDSHYF